MSDTRNWGIGTRSPGLNIGYQPGTGEWTISQGNNAYNASYVQVSSSAPITNLVYAGASKADLGYKPLLVRNTVNGLITMTNAGFDAGVRCPSVVAGDFDNDMDEDLFLACTGGARNISNKVYVNDGRGVFRSWRTREAQPAGPARPSRRVRARATAWSPLTTTAMASLTCS